MSQENQNELGRVSRVIDFRVPLPYLLSAFAALTFTLFSMYINVNQVLRDVADLQATVKSSNSSTITLAGEQALLRFRLENVESSLRDLRNEGAKK